MENSSSEEISYDAIMYMIHHAFLPPELPQCSDFDPEHEKMLLNTVSNTLQMVKRVSGYDQPDAVEPAVDLIKSLKLVRDEMGFINQEKLEEVFRSLPSKGGIIPLHVRAQNAGLVVSKTNEEICFEAFELLPLNEAVIQTKGRLRRSFPGCAFAVSQATFIEDGFQATLALTIAKMSHQTVPEMLPQVKKKGQMDSENRDTAHPKLVTEHLMNFVRAAGKPVRTSPIWKNTRDEVMLLDSLHPWQRSPMWLLVRVALQLTFSRLAVPTNPKMDLYKVFVVLLLARVLKMSHAHANLIRNDLFLVMNAKISQRLLKLGIVQEFPWLTEVRQVMSKTHELLEKRWQNAITKAHTEITLPCPELHNFAEDTLINLSELDDFIAAVAKRETTTPVSHFSPTSTLPTYPRETLPTSLVTFPREYQAFNLAAFEKWVKLHLPTWLAEQANDPTICEKLKNSIESYHASAAAHYTGNPEGYSVMIVTVMELWIACDKFACGIFDLLSDYDPEIPVNLFQSLVLPFKSQMDRLLSIEKYFKDRQSIAKDSLPSIFRTFGDPSSFPVRYFNKSPEHQTLISEIEDWASRKRKEKLQELLQKQEQYRDLMQLRDASDCESYEVVDESTGLGRYKHSNSCKKCSYTTRANSISIKIHEWPISSNSSEAKTTVFELKAPLAFRAWRDVTTYVLTDVLGCEYSESLPPGDTYTLRTDPGLLSFFDHNESSQRIYLLSQVKPHAVTHRREKCIVGLTSAEVCKNNGLQYQYYDDSMGLFTRGFNATDKILDLCTYSLPGPAVSLQKFLVRPPSMPNGLPPNTVIAQQSECPDYISLEEFKAFGTLSLGCQIQWMNILTQLPSPSLDFSKKETNALLLQTIYQAGPPNENNVRRVSHEILADENFGLVFLKELGNALERVRENWESLQAVGSFIQLAVRLLSLSSSQKIQMKCMEYLANARKIVFSWVKLLHDKARQSRDECQREEFLAIVVQAALFCVNTFDIDQHHLEIVLSCAPEASLLIQCSMAIEECSYSILKTVDQNQSIMLGRWNKLLYRIMTEITRQITVMKSTCLDDAIKISWSDHRTGSVWRSIQSPYEHWLTCQTEPLHTCKSFSVHYNLLTAELLVNGIPLAHLPSKYEGHWMYGILFDRLRQEVMPTRFPGLEFSAKQKYSDHNIYFGMQLAPTGDISAKSDLLLHAVKNDRKYDLLPPRIFCDKFPLAFVNDFVHWYDYGCGSIEFRPKKDPWLSSPANWWLTKVGHVWRLAHNEAVLVSILSNTAKRLTDTLSTIETPLNIHISLNKHSESLDLNLPRLQLSFYLKTGNPLIFSGEYRGMSIDMNQNIGTLIGLQNKLVLKQEKGGHDRVVLIPEGQVTYRKSFDHILVSIDTRTAVKVHAYHIDRRLGRVLDNGNLQSKLFLCYLHGLTSNCIPDPLLRRTGTEQALSILRSAAVRSFDYLKEGNILMLGLIASLTPARNFYPLDKRVMHTVNWNPNLGFVSQHGDFYTSVKAIFEQAVETKFFHPNLCMEKLRLDFLAEHLLERDLIRSSFFRVSDFGADLYTTRHDAEYTPRDRGQNSERAIQTFVTASLIFQGKPILHARSDSNLRNSIWNLFMKRGTITGPDSQLEIASLNFDCTLLEDPVELLGLLWCRVHFSFRTALHLYNRFHIMMWLSTMAFARNANTEAIRTLASFYNIQEVAQIPVPQISLFDISRGAKVVPSEVADVIRSACYPFSRCPEANLRKNNWESQACYKQRKNCEYQKNQNVAVNSFQNGVESQWPCECPNIPHGSIFSKYLDVNEAIYNIRSKFKIWFENYLLFEYLGRIKIALQHQAVSPIPVPHDRFPVRRPVQEIKKRFVNLDDLFASTALSIPSEGPASLNAREVIESTETRMTSRIETLLTGMNERITAKYEFNYIRDLFDSAASLRDLSTKNLSIRQGSDLKHLLERYMEDCNLRVNGLFALMMEFAGGEGQNPYAKMITLHQWPRVSTTLFLEQLTYRRFNKLTEGWKKCIINFGLAMTELQRAERMLRLSDNPIDLKDDLLNTGHGNWDPFKFPEILLLEVESGIMIRDVQEEIAQKMRNPPSGRNAVMQLNMGEGKSSVIVPIVVVTGADGTQIIRVIVAKAQSKQMFQMLVSKLGGFLGRRVYHMPFSRALKLDTAQVDAINSVYRDCMANRGVFLVQPEHILSFKLMALECLVTGRKEVARSLLATQFMLDGNTRDIVDESDENFSVKFELIYTMGTQRPIDFSPDRWATVQLVLDLVARFAREIKICLPQSVDVNERWPGRFPRIRILCLDANKLILERIGHQICQTGFPGFPIARQLEKVRQAVFKYITSPVLSTEEIMQVEDEQDGSFWTESTRGYLLLLRGLLGGGVLSFAFGLKRWRVNYGIDPHREPKTKLAVPFRAKDNPSLRSEFSHPDVVIVLTSLSYYYGGLSDDDLFIAFNRLIQSDRAHIEYGEWVRTAPELPNTFRRLVGINVKDRFQCIEQIFPFLRYSKGAIDYFLSHIVFPKEMKEFPHKISASGWDIGQTKVHPTTGFSGTNDSRHLLPLSVHHLDLPKQKHTNALVLEYLLRDENSVIDLPRAGPSTVSDAELLLATVEKMNPSVQVILDVGAQILELSNYQVARQWLNMRANHEQTKAVIFFNDNDELSVMDRNGRIELLQVSAFAKQLDVCLVFLDEAHTRGTDLRLPSYYRAAVTLGANLTKDRLVQACMRMRKLGNGQSVSFIVPEEIRTKIIESTAKQCNSALEVIDVLNWVLSETLIDLKRSMPLWAVQGQRFEYQKTIWDAARGVNGFEFRDDEAEQFLEKEAQTLDDRYRPRASSEDLQGCGRNTVNESINHIFERCQEYGSQNFASSTLQEEQERELAPEIQQECQKERPEPMKPEKHSIHKDLRSLVMTGIILAQSKAFMPAFEAFRSSSAAAHLDVSQFPQDLLITADFSRTVKFSQKNCVSDDYHRPVQWVLTTTTTIDVGESNTVKNMVVISPYEAENLLLLIKQYNKVTLHVYAPRPNLEYRSLDALDLFVVGKAFDSCTVPRHLTVQLNLFSGQLYLNSFQEYIEVCNFLGLAWKTIDEGDMIPVRPDGFIGSASGEGGFKDSPVKFLMMLMTKIRRNCESIEKTHLGAILSGGLLEEANFS